MWQNVALCDFMDYPRFTAQSRSIVGAVVISYALVFTLGLGELSAMDKDALRAALERLGWSQAALARRLGFHVNTVNKWATGKVDAPHHVAEYLRAMLLVLEIVAAPSAGPKLDPGLRRLVKRSPAVAALADA